MYILKKFRRFKEWHKMQNYSQHIKYSVYIKELIDSHIHSSTE